MQFKKDLQTFDGEEEVAAENILFNARRSLAPQELKTAESFIPEKMQVNMPSLNT